MISGCCGQASRDSQGSKADEHRLGFEMNVPEFFHALLDMVFQSQDVGGGGFSAVHDGQRMFARDADSPAAVAFAEAGVLHQPGGGNFSLGIERGIAGNLQSLGRRAPLKFVVLFGA